MPESCTAIGSPSISPGARTCTLSPGPGAVDLHQILGTLQSLHQRGAVKWLERVTKRSKRTCKYWLSGTYAPRGGDALKIARALRVELDQQRERLQQFELQF